MLNRHGSKPSKNQRNLRETLNLFLTDYVFPADRADWCADLSDTNEVDLVEEAHDVEQAWV